MVGVPVQVPVEAVDVRFRAHTPEIDGSTVLAGAAAAITAVGSLAAQTDPPALLAVTTTRRVCSTSAGVSK